MTELDSNPKEMPIGGEQPIEQQSSSPASANLLSEATLALSGDKLSSADFATLGTSAARYTKNLKTGEEVKIDGQSIEIKPESILTARNGDVLAQLQGGRISIVNLTTQEVVVVQGQELRSADRLVQDKAGNIIALALIDVGKANFPERYRHRQEGSKQFEFRAVNITKGEIVGTFDDRGDLNRVSQMILGADGHVYARIHPQRDERDQRPVVLDATTEKLVATESGDRLQLQKGDSLAVQNTGTSTNGEKQAYIYASPGRFYSLNGGTATLDIQADDVAIVGQVGWIDASERRKLAF